MDRVPFSVYDIFGYLAAGFLFLVGVDYIMDTGWVIRNDLRLAPGILWTGAAFIIGQVLATPSSSLIEGWLLGCVLGRPSTNLFATGRPDDWRVTVLPGYYRPLSPKTQERVRRRTREAGVEDVGEDLFQLAFGAVKSQSETMARLETFVTRYGFCRNIAFTALLGIPLIPVLCAVSGNWDRLWTLLVAVVVAIGMLYRYLKFHRQYSYEVFVTYGAG
ncbi:MAG: hypothetical protein M3Q71_00125 [Chloroflexota bacterium]|nr:hypothetical protein [Chloroflexota bacterium]